MRQHLSIQRAAGPGPPPEPPRAPRRPPSAAADGGPGPMADRPSASRHRPVPVGRCRDQYALLTLLPAVVPEAAAGAAPVAEVADVAELAAAEPWAGPR